MIFGRKNKAEEVDDADIEDIEDVDDTEDLDEDIADEDDEYDFDEEDLDEWELFDDSQDWREDGPFDIDEVELSGDEVKRIDLGAMIITPENGMTIKLVANPATQQILHLVVENGPESAVQITVLAAPADGSYCTELRGELIAQTEKATSVELVKGPFGTEIRRVITVTDDQGHQGHAPVRDWLISGPRWILNARLLGKAALDTEGTGASEDLKEFVHNIIVRRGDAAMMPGAVLPLTPAS